MALTEAYSLCLAPMRGVTTRMYRGVYARFFTGLDRAMAPFIPTVKTARIKPRLLADIEPEPAGSVPLVPQIISKDADDIRLMLRAMADMGYREVNWNLGCPWPQVTRRMRGSGLLPHPDLICEILDRVLADTPVGFSVKLRLGKEDPGDIMCLLPRLDAYPLTEVIIHPRTARQMYEGTTDVGAFERCLPLTRHEICYNGDIFCRADFERLAERFPRVRRWMLGRGVLRDPFLPARLRGNGVVCEAERDRIRAFHDELYFGYRAAYYGPSPVLGKMKEFWSYLSRSFSEPERVFKAIRKTQRLDQYEAMVNDVFQATEWCPGQEGNEHD